MKEIGEPATPNDIAVAALLKSPNVRRLLLKMARAGLVAREDTANIVSRARTIPPKRDHCDRMDIRNRSHRSHFHAGSLNPPEYLLQFTLSRSVTLVLLTGHTGHTSTE